MPTASEALSITPRVAPARENTRLHAGLARKASSGIDGRPRTRAASWSAWRSPVHWITGPESYSGAAAKPAHLLVTRQTSDLPPGIADSFAPHHPPRSPQDVIKAE